MASGLPLIVPDSGGCAEVADPLTSEIYTARDAGAAAAAIARLYARDQAMLRRAACVAACRVRSDREHAVELMDYYAGLVAAKRASRTG
jgi:alpha-1,6-mannosyltransferase